MSYGGQSSTDYYDHGGRIRVLYRGTSNSLSTATDDAYTQANPALAFPSPQATPTSSTLSGITKVGVLGGSVSFSRPSNSLNVAAEFMNGGPRRRGGNPIGANAAAGAMPHAEDLVTHVLGLFMNDANGNAFENQAGVASGKAPYMAPSGTVGVQLYETRQQVDWVRENDGAAVTWGAGDFVYASNNGLITNQVRDALEAYSTGVLNDAGDGISDNADAAVAAPKITILGCVKISPTAAVPEVAFDLRSFTYRDVA